MSHENLKAAYTRVEKPRISNYTDNNDYLYDIIIYTDQTEDDLAKVNAQIGSLKSDLKVWKLVSVISVVISAFVITIKLIQ